MTWKSDANSKLRFEAKFNISQNIYELVGLLKGFILDFNVTLYFNFWVFFLVQEKYLSADKTLQNAKPADVVYER